MNYTHLLESRSHRRHRLQSYCSAQPLCSNGSAHAWRSSNPKDVDCPNCLELMKNTNKLILMMNHH